MPKTTIYKDCHLFPAEHDISFTASTFKFDVVILSETISFAMQHRTNMPFRLGSDLPIGFHNRRNGNR